MPAHRHGNPGVKHMSTRNSDGQALPEHSMPASQLKDSLKRTAVLFSELRRT